VRVGHDLIARLSVETAISIKPIPRLGSRAV
jgi:hypothetical protein